MSAGRWFDCPARRPPRPWLARLADRILALRGYLIWREPEGRKRILPGMDNTQLGAGWMRTEPPKRP